MLDSAQPCNQLQQEFEAAMTGRPGCASGIPAKASAGVRSASTAAAAFGKLNKGVKKTGAAAKGKPAQDWRRSKGQAKEQGPQQVLLGVGLQLLGDKNKGI
jgi:hypothetical protein